MKKRLQSASWRTTLIGMLAMLLAAGAIWGPPDMHDKLLTAAITVAGGGLLLAKDHAK